MRSTVIAIPPEGRYVGAHDVRFRVTDPLEGCRAPIVLRCSFGFWIEAIFEDFASTGAEKFFIAALGISGARPACNQHNIRDSGRDS
jgi:hypothetical protein